jgi:hypothetical protein
MLLPAMLLRATDFHATYVVAAPFTLPHHSGSLLRGVLGRALRRTGCASLEGACAAACRRPDACTYARLFDPPAPSPAPHRFLQGATRAPPRLIPLLPPMGAIDLAAGGAVGFGVRVLGELDDDTEKRLVGALEGIAELPLGTDGGRVVFDSVTRRGPRNRPLPDVRAPSGARRVRVTFETPAWIEHQGKLVEELTFSRLYRAISRRLTTVCALYGDLGPDHDSAFARQDALASAVETVGVSLRRLRWERLSEERGERHPMRGLTGWAVFEGELGEVLPVLAMAEAAHVGKATAFGLGRLRVEVDAGIPR